LALQSDNTEIKILSVIYKYCLAYKNRNGYIGVYRKINELIMGDLTHLWITHVR